MPSSNDAARTSSRTSKPRAGSNSPRGRLEVGELRALRDQREVAPRHLLEEPGHELFLGARVARDDLGDRLLRLVVVVERARRRCERLVAFAVELRPRRFVAVRRPQQARRRAGRPRQHLALVAFARF